MEILKVVPRCKLSWREWFEVETGELRTFSIMCGPPGSPSLIDVKVDKKYDGCYIRVTATEGDKVEKLFYYIVKVGEKEREIKKAKARMMIGVDPKTGKPGPFYFFRMWKGDL